MIKNNRLYELGFRFREEKPWENIWDTDIYGLRFSDGEIGYICTMGRTGTFYGIAIYQDIDALRQMYNLIIEFEEEKSIMAGIEESHNQNCIQIALGDELDLEPGEVDFVENYGKTHGYDMTIENAFPHFLRLSPGMVPWPKFDKKDEKHMEEALEAVLLMGKMLKEKSIEDFGIVDIRDSDDELMIAEMYEGKLNLYPQQVDFMDGYTDYPGPEIDEFTAAKIKKQVLKESYECEVVMIPEPVLDDDYDVPFYPYSIMMVSRETGMAPFVDIVRSYDADYRELLRNVADMFIEHGTCPKELLARDLRTFYFLEDLAEKVGAEISVEPYLPQLDEMEADFLDNLMNDEFDPEEFDGLLDQLAGMPDEVLKDMPPEIEGALLEIYMTPDIPEEAYRKIGSVLERAGKKPRLN